MACSECTTLRRNQPFTLSHSDVSKEFPSTEDLSNAKSRKNLVLTGAMRFNTKPKAGLAYLEENGLIYADLDSGISRARSLAIFLKGCSRLDKRLLGDFISRPDNTELLKEFISLFDFKDVSNCCIFYLMCGS